jgi:enoyl-CoA hydratase/carnithine racemase
VSAESVRGREQPLLTHRVGQLALLAPRARQAIQQALRDVSDALVSYGKGRAFRQQQQLPSGAAADARRPADIPELNRVLPARTDRMRNTPTIGNLPTNRLRQIAGAPLALGVELALTCDMRVAGAVRTRRLCSPVSLVRRPQVRELG